MSATADACQPGTEGRAKLVRGSIAFHTFNQTWPLVIGVAAIMSVGIVDAYYVGQLGSAPLAAMAFVFPVITALSSLGVGVMVGIASVVSRAVGGGDHERAASLASLGFLVALAVGTMLGVALWALRHPLFALLQADATLLPLTDAYMGPYSLGLAVQLGMMGVNGTLRAQGAAARSMAMLVAYAGVNWLLNPMLVLGRFGVFPAYGIAGAAYATIASFTAAAALGAVLLQTSPLRLSIASLRRCRLGPDTLALARVGAPAAVANAINPVGIALLTALLASLGHAAVAGYGAAGRLQSFATVPLLGLSGSIGAIVGQNFGAGEQDRVRRSLLYAGGFSLAYGAAVAVPLVVFREALSGLFSADAAVRAEFERYLLVAAWGYGGFGVFIVANGALNAVDRAGLAFAQSVARVALFMLPVAFLLRHALGSTATYLAELSANLLGAIVAVVAAWFVFWCGRDRGGKSGSSSAGETARS